jgi:P27 family predicted phage terminase small subunit
VKGVKASQWRPKIKKQCEEMKTFQPSFNSAIDTLAKILEQRYAALEQFKREGSVLIIEKTSDRGAVNSAVNPLVRLIDTLNNTALSYWRELGLTPSSFRKMTGSTAPAEEKKNGLAAALRAIETD